jgi:DnaJ domain
MAERSRDGTAERTVDDMTADHGESLPDLYEVLNVDPAAPREEIVRAWRRRARAEHPDSRPHDHAAPARFRALAEAYQVLSDPARRAAYDRAAGYRPGSSAAVPAGPSDQVLAAPRTGPAGQTWVTPVVRAPEAPLRAGPVRVEPSPADPAAGGWAYAEVMPAELVLWYLAGWRRPW